MKRPTTYAFTDKPAFRQKWAFRSEKGFADKTGFLAAVVQLPEADRFRFLRDGKALFRLSGLKTPEDVKPNVFVHARQFFVTLRDGKGSGMGEGRWYEFEAGWNVAPK